MPSSRHSTVSELMATNSSTIMSMQFSKGSDAKGICYIELKQKNNGHIFGVGIHSNINVAALRGIICAINRAEK